MTDKDLNITSGHARSNAPIADGWHFELNTGNITYVKGPVSFAYPIDVGLKVWAQDLMKDEINRQKKSLNFIKEFCECVEIDMNRGEEWTKEELYEAIQRLCVEAKNGLNEVNT